MHIDIPDDILRQIFLTLYDSTPSDIIDVGNMWDGQGQHKPGPFARERVAYTLAAVCRSWKSIAEETSHLWSEVSYAGSRGVSAADALEEFNRHLNLSGTQLLPCVRLTLDKPDDTSDGVSLRESFSVLLPHLHRVRRLFIIVNEAWPTLGSLQVLADGAMLGYKRDMFESKYTRESRTLWLSNPMHLLPRDRPLTGFPTTWMRHLVLHHVAFNRVSELAILLQHCIRLITLTLLGTNDMIRDETAQAKFELPALQALRIDCDHLRVLSELRLRTPKLLALEVCKLVSHQDFAHDIEWDFAQNVEDLTFVRGWTDPEINHALHSLNRLRTLRLFHCPTGHFLTNVLKMELPPVLNASGFYVPKLELLVVDGGQTDDEDIRHLVIVRNSSITPQLKTLRFQLKRCVNLSSRTQRLLEITGRGTVELVPLQEGEVFRRKDFICVDADVFPLPF